VSNKNTGEQDDRQRGGNIPGVLGDAAHLDLPPLWTRNAATFCAYVARWLHGTWTYPHLLLADDILKRRFCCAFVA